jgi:hypothetical protein
LRIPARRRCSAAADTAPAERGYPGPLTRAPVGTGQSRWQRAPGPRLGCGGPTAAVAPSSGSTASVSGTQGAATASAGARPAAPGGPGRPSDSDLRNARPWPTPQLPVGEAPLPGPLKASELLLARALPLTTLLVARPRTPACAPASPPAGTRASSTAPPRTARTLCSPPPTRIPPPRTPPAPRTQP